MLSILALAAAAFAAPQQLGPQIQPTNWGNNGFNPSLGVGGAPTNNFNNWNNNGNWNNQWNNQQYQRCNLPQTTCNQVNIAQQKYCGFNGWRDRFGTQHPRDASLCGLFQYVSWHCGFTNNRVQGQWNGILPNVQSVTSDDNPCINWWNNQNNGNNLPVNTGGQFINGQWVTGQAGPQFNWNGVIGQCYGNQFVARNNLGNNNNNFNFGNNNFGNTNNQFTNQWNGRCYFDPNHCRNANTYTSLFCGRQNGWHDVGTCIFMAGIQANYCF